MKTSKTSSILLTTFLIIVFVWVTITILNKGNSYKNTQPENLTQLVEIPTTCYNKIKVAGKLRVTLKQAVDFKVLVSSENVAKYGVNIYCHNNWLEFVKDSDSIENTENLNIVICYNKLTHLIIDKGAHITGNYLNADSLQIKNLKGHLKMDTVEVSNLEYTGGSHSNFSSKEYNGNTLSLYSAESAFIFMQNCKLTEINGVMQNNSKIRFHGDVETLNLKMDEKAWVTKF